MKVVHLNTNLNITSAPYQLHQALLNKGIESSLLIFNECSLQGAVSPKHDTAYKLWRRAMAKLRSTTMEKYTPDPYMYFTAMPVGLDVSRHPLVQESDVIMLHWICGDYLSPKEIEQILKLGKKTYFVCHDNYHFTGGCHVRLGCTRYTKGCGACPQLCSFDHKDITAQLIKDKISCYKKYDNFEVLSPSSWMDGNVSESMVFAGKKHRVFPNTINTTIFRPYDGNVVRKIFDIPKDKRVILTAIKADEKVPYNGMDYLYTILEKLQSEENYVVVFGVDELKADRAKGFHNVGFVSDRDKLAKLYSAADIFLTSSLEDSFNQTVAECMACGTPVVAFDNAGITDIIDHKKNGYLARFKDTDDFVRGVKFILNNTTLSSPRKKILKCFSFEVVADRFVKMVNEAN